jgi:hypothetical protein
VPWEVAEEDIGVGLTAQGIGQEQGKYFNSTAMQKKSAEKLPIF